MKHKLYPSYIILGICFLSLIIFGLVMDTPRNIVQGLKNIVAQSDILVTDYISIGGIGAAFINAGLLGILSIALLVYIGIKPIGSTIMSLWLMVGFGLFGKNIFNIWPVIFGVWLYAKYQKEPFLNFILIALLGTTLSPAVGQLKFIPYLVSWQGSVLGALIGTGIGFILPPIVTYSIKLHQGYNLYNTGFAAGLLATMLMSVIRAFGVNFDKRLIWYRGSNTIFSIFLITLFLLLIAIGFIMNDYSFKNLNKLMKSSGRTVSDFFITFKNCTYINMGILGIIFTLYILIVKSDLNGPTMGAIFTIVGFGAFGKHVKNVVPVLLGAVLSSLLNIWPLNSPEMVLSCIFSTTLAPIAGHYGFRIGILAGFLHVCMVMNTGYLHGGLNLYNNGLAGGLVAIVLLPVIEAFRKDKIL
jgi:hypothetical protein